MNFSDELLQPGNSKLVLKPGSTAEVAAILKYCNERRLAVVPQGGNTGLVGGSVPICDEIVLSLARLNKVLSVDEVTGIAVVEAGCILENFDQRAREVGGCGAFRAAPGQELRAH